MPELPEVETTMSALQPFVEKKIVSVDINNRNLRWKIEKDFEKNISNKKIISITRSCLLYTSPSPRDATLSRMPSSA